jgi:release factor glutamine methyltransferase
MKTNEKTLNDLWNESARFLEEWGLEDAQWESRLLLSELLELSGVNFLLELHRPLKQAVPNRLQSLLERRVQGEPLQYLVRNVNFMGYEFEVTPGVFIPRPETEILVENLVDRIRNHASHDMSRPVHVLDIGTGCGNISLSLALLVPNAQIISMDVSQDALAVAQRNAKRLGVKGRVEFLHHDIRTGINNQQTTFDYIVSNPPYIKRSDITSLSPEVQLEPHEALDGGDDGLDFFREISNRFAPFLNTPGCLVFEIGWGQACSVVRILAGTRRFFRFDVIKDYCGIDRIVVAHKIS